MSTSPQRNDLTPLPIDPVIPRIVEVLREKRAVVLEAPPGAGKTTRVPPALLSVFDGDIVVLEPRRLAARLSARRVAEELGERVGERVGYEVRFERVVSKDTRLSFVTEGVLTRRLLGDRSLRGVSVVVLDEFHERHLQGDLALALLRDARPDLKLLVMSATLDAAPIARYLGRGDDTLVPVVTSEGRRYEVAVEHLPRADDRPLASQVASAVRALVQGGLDGDVLVFLPGAAEIRKAEEACRKIAEEADLLVLPLHGELPPAQQDRAIEKASRRKVILSTNVAETSITIDGVVAVVDSGLARIAGHDPWTGRPTLDVARISRASAAQRTGRAGRTRPGRALRLYTKGDHDTRAEHDLPEISRVDLAETILSLRAFGVSNPAAFPWLDAPSKAALDAADELLRRLGATDARGQLTKTGARMAGFGLPPRAARLLVEAEARGVGDDGCTLAAMLSEGRDVFARTDFGRGGRDDDAVSDLLVRLDALGEAAADSRDSRDSRGARDRRRGIDADRARRAGLDVGSAMAIDRVREKLARQVARDRTPSVHPDDALRMAVLAAFPDRVARRRAASGGEGRIGVGQDLVLAGGGSAVLDPASVVKTAPWLVAVEARDQSQVGQPRRARVFLASAIEPEWLIDLFPESITETVDVSWNATAERVEASAKMLYDKLVLDERPAGKDADEPAAALLAERALSLGVSAFLTDEQGAAFESLRARLAFLVATAPDLAKAAKLTLLDDEALRAMLVSRCAGKRSFAELRDHTLLEELRGAIGHGALQKLDELAPAELRMRNGRHPRIEYAPGQPPSVSSRLQDFFGSVETPRVCAGRVALVLHLLAPNGRDVQVTSDLGGFWTRTYPQVRSELMRRYPRHAWPDDPRTAAPPTPRR